jgi:hypothetical protein
MTTRHIVDEDEANAIRRARAEVSREMDRDLSRRMTLTRVSEIADRHGAPPGTVVDGGLRSDIKRHNRDADRVRSEREREDGHESASSRPGNFDRGARRERYERLRAEHEERAAEERRAKAEREVERARAVFAHNAARTRPGPPTTPEGRGTRSERARRRRRRRGA